jgi:hypothetical protein
MTGVGGGELNHAVHNRPTGRSALGLQSPGSAPIKKKKKNIFTELFRKALRWRKTVGKQLLL